MTGAAWLRVFASGSASPPLAEGAAPRRGASSMLTPIQAGAVPFTHA
jgi:hypothetical protein